TATGIRSSLVIQYTYLVNQIGYGCLGKSQQGLRINAYGNDQHNDDRQYDPFVSVDIRNGCRLRIYFAQHYLLIQTQHVDRSENQRQPTENGIPHAVLIDTKQ